MADLLGALRGRAVVVEAGIAEPLRPNVPKCRSVLTDAGLLVSLRQKTAQLSEGILQ